MLAESSGNGFRMKAHQKHELNKTKKNPKLVKN